MQVLKSTETTLARRVRRLWVGALLFSALAATVEAKGQALGPADRGSFPPLDTSRVAVGTMAPDFTLQTKDGGTVTLSQFRRKKDVVLVFYRGHW